MYIKVFFNDKPLFLCDQVDETIEPFLHHDDAVFIDELDNHTVKSMIHEMQLEKVHAGVFIHPDFEALKKAFFKNSPSSRQQVALFRMKMVNYCSSSAGVNGICPKANWIKVNHWKIVPCGKWKKKQG